MTGAELEARARREASTLLAEVHPDMRIEQYARLHDVVALAWMRGYTAGMTETTDDFRKTLEGENV